LDRKLKRLFVKYPGAKDYALNDEIEVLALPSVRRLSGGLGI
jgi:hypothetical protein